MRGVPFRDVFDSAFDTIVKLQVPSPYEAWEMLARRSEGLEGFPLPVVLFCYAWSGAFPAISFAQLAHALISEIVWVAPWTWLNWLRRL